MAALRHGELDGLVLSVLGCDSERRALWYRREPRSVKVVLRWKLTEVPMSFLERLAHVYPDSDLAGFECYLVDDCVGGCEVKVVLLCESPHTDEVASRPRRPLSGKSGKSVARVLRELALCQNTDGDTPIGDLVCGGDEDFDWLGIMNACPVPMQKKPYRTEALGDLGDEIDDLASVRTKSAATPRQRALEKAIADDLAARWRCVNARIDPNALVIACGETARRFHSLAGLRAGQDLPNVPHPSREQWTKALQLYRCVLRIRDVLGS